MNVSLEHLFIHAALAGPSSGGASSIVPSRQHSRRAPREVVTQTSSGGAAEGKAPWAPEELLQLNQQVEQEREAELGQEWRSQFSDNLDGLFEYVGDAEAEWESVVEDLYKLPPNEWEVCLLLVGLWRHAIIISIDSGLSHQSVVLSGLLLLPLSCNQNSGELEAAYSFPPAMANELIGMGTWRLKGQVNPCIEFLVQRLEGTWREICVDGE